MFKIGFSRFLRIFAVAFELGLSYGVMVTRQILVLKFQVRILVAQPNGKPAVQQRVFCVFGGRPSRLGRGGFVRSFSEAPGFRFRGGEALDGSVFGADRTVCSVCGAGAFRRLRPCRALRLRGGGGLWTVPFWRRALPCGSVFGADRAMRSVRGAGRLCAVRFQRLPAFVFGAGRLRTAPFLEVPGFRFRCGDALDGSFSGQAVPCVSFAGRRSFRRLRPCRAAKRRNGGRRVGR